MVRSMPGWGVGLGRGVGVGDGMGVGVAKPRQLRSMGRSEAFCRAGRPKRTTA